ncbi:amidohydrolase family protein [Brevibacterium album]|uniref:amidohydrolase family protein n=1 Tax=Brevibacterium album TaxID=417948 RepID=UPI000406F610|nr:amidohydrolase family protein [Brevibacterium album]
MCSEDQEGGHGHSPVPSARRQVPAPDRAEGAHAGRTVVMRGVTIIDGTGAPAYGPADLVLSEGRIVEIADRTDPIARSLGGSGDLEHRHPDALHLDLKGHYVMPGLVDSHAHIGSAAQAPSAEYVYKLWLAHGVTTVREVGCLNGLDFTLHEAERSADDAITAPRILPNPVFGLGGRGPITAPEEAIEWVRGIAGRGAAGVKFFGAEPGAFEAALREINELGLDSACHHEQRRVRQVNAMTTARWGLRSVEHWYGLPEAMFRDRTVQDLPPGYNYSDEPARYASGGPLWLQTAAPGSPVWQETLEEFVSLGLTMSPTFNIYIGHRDAARVRGSEWHGEFTAPQLWDFFEPSPDSHGSVYGDWGTEQEIPWRQAYVRWMALVNDYKNLGGRVTAGSDSGFIYKTFGFGIIEELELLREAGFHPLEVVRAATLSGAELTGLDRETGSVEVGKRADLVVLSENPLQNLKVMYAHGALRYADGVGARHAAVRFTVKNGIVYDAERLRADVREIVAEERARAHAVG